MPGDFPTGIGFKGFKHALNHRAYLLAEQMMEETGSKAHDFVMPIGLFLVIDKKNGGGITGNELIRRFHLLDLESKNAIDFYFLGWRWRNEIDHSKGIRFDLHSFEECRNALRDIGVKTPFGGSADLILVDLRYRYRNGPRDADGLPAYYGYTELDLNFPEAIQINLATSRDKGEIPPLGDFLQSIIEVAESLHERGDNQSPVYSISDKLGIATAKRSFLDFILKKWGGIIGADKLAPLAVRNLGPAAYIYAESAKDNVLAVGGDLQALPVSPRG